MLDSTSNENFVKYVRISGLWMWLLMLVLWASCSPSSNPRDRGATSKAGETNKQAVDSIKSINQLYSRYETGTPEEARSSLLEIDNYVEHLPHGREWAQFLQHSRLHCLAKAQGREDEAYLEFVKVQYWWLKNKERGETLSAAELVARMKEQVTERECDRIIIELDRRGATGGMAQYWKALFGSDASPEAWLYKQYGRCGL